MHVGAEPVGEARRGEATMMTAPVAASALARFDDLAERLAVLEARHLIGQSRVDQRIRTTQRLHQRHDLPLEK